MNAQSLSILAAFAITSAGSAVDPIYVDAGATGTDDGTSWTNAYSDLQDALAEAAAAGAGEIWVAKGVYKPAPPGGSRFISFQMKDGVRIYGGFEGAESSRAERDVHAHETILSGDLNGNDDGSVGTMGDNSYHVINGQNADATSMLDGLTITAGYANHNLEHWGRGAGMFVEAPPGGVLVPATTLVNCTFVHNRTGSWAGGGLYSIDVEQLLINCRFIGNSTVTGGGGGVYAWRAPLTLINCEFSGNTCSTINGGGGMVARHTPSPKLINCVFSRNRNIGGTRGGGIYSDTFGALSLTNCIFWENIDDTGNGQSAQIYVVGGAPSVNYSCVQGWTGSLGGTGNHGSDPRFVDFDGPDDQLGTADDDLRLRSGSPCIDAGDNTVVPADVTDLDEDGDVIEPTPLDLVLDERFRDDATTADSGNGVAPIVDMGGREYACAIDLDQSGIIDFADLVALLVAWGPCSGCPADFNDDGDVGFQDLVTLLAAWGPCL